jgi:hypothetical protein
MFLFLFKFLITNVVFSVIICSIFTRFNESGKYSNSELLLYSLGLGPVFTALLLYYSFLILPHRSIIFYLMFIAAVYFLIAVIGRKSFRRIFCDVKNSINKIVIFEQNASICRKVEHIVLLSIIFISMVAFLFVYLTKILPQPLIGWDSLTHGISGRNLYYEKSLADIWAQYTTYPPAFSLLFTWEEFVNFIFQVKSDLYFKSISTYYGLLIISIQYYWVAKQNKWVAVLSVFALLSGVSFFISLLQPHLDLYRIFFYVISFIWLAYAVKEEDCLSLLMFGIFSGFTAFTHRIGVVIAVINCFVFFITIKSSFQMRVLKAFIIILLILAFGGDHYIFDLIWGQGAWLKP